MLALDSAGSACSAAVLAGNRVLAARDQAMLHGQVEALLPMADEAMRTAGLSPRALDLIAVTTGPGSFTGIRVGLAAARGVGLALGVPVVGVTSFEATAASVGADPDCCLLVALDSRRAELYLQMFARGGAPVGAPAAVPAEALPDAVEAVFGRQSLAVAGDAAHRAAAALAGRTAPRLLEPGASLAVGCARAALGRLRRGEPGGEPKPLYLRPPGVTLAPPPASARS